MSSKYRLWTYKEVEFLKSNYSKMSAEMIAKELRRTKGSVQSQVKKLGLKKRNNLYRVRNKDGEVIAYGSPTELSERLNVNKKTIHEYSTPSYRESPCSFIVEKAGVTSE